MGMAAVAGGARCPCMDSAVGADFRTMGSVAKEACRISASVACGTCIVVTFCLSISNGTMCCAFACAAGAVVDVMHGRRDLLQPQSR